MALYDDKRFILSHLRHSFITGDDSGMCETTMLPEPSNRYRYEAIYHHPFDYDSDDDEMLLNDAAGGNSSFDNGFQFTQDEISLLKKTEINHESEFAEDSEHNRTQSLDILSDSLEMDIRRRSNTAQRLERLKKEKKNLAKTKIIGWKSPLQIVSENQKGHLTRIKRAVLDTENLPENELKLLEYDAKNNVFYETRAYRELLFPKRCEESHESKFSDELEEPLNENENLKKTSESRRPKSALTLQIEKSSTVPTNPFNEYARFDGRISNSNADTKRFRIFFKLHVNNSDSEPCDFTKHLTSSSSEIAYGPDWIEVIVLTNARICDLIGLICWHYTRLQLGPMLKPDPLAYALKIAEENGDFDNEFPNLNFTDDIKRYGFPCLAMVSVETHIVVTVAIVPEGTFSQLVVTSPSATLNFLIDQIKKKRSNLFQSKSVSYHLERRSTPGVSLDLNGRVSDYVENSANADFVLVIDDPQDPSGKTPEHSSHTPEKTLTLPRVITTGLRLNKSSSALYNMTHTSVSEPNGGKKKTRNPDDISSNMFDIMKAPLYQCFDVFAINKLYHAPVEMGIWETKLQITPKIGRARSPTSHFTDRFLFKLQKVKAMTINLEDVVDCHLVTIHKQISEKQTFKIVYWNGNDFKSIKFESDSATVDDIIFKLEHVMKMRTSVRRKEYNTMNNKKKNISTKIHFKPKSSGSSSSGTDEPSSSATKTSPNDDGPLMVDHRRDSKFLKFLPKHE